MDAFELGIVLILMALVAGTLWVLLSFWRPRTPRGYPEPIEHTIILIVVKRRKEPIVEQMLAGYEAAREMTRRN